MFGIKIFFSPVATSHLGWEVFLSTVLINYSALNIPKVLKQKSNSHNESGSDAGAADSAARVSVEVERAVII